MKVFIIAVQVFSVLITIAFIAGVVYLGYMLATEIDQNGLKSIIENIWEGAK